MTTWIQIFQGLPTRQQGAVTEQYKAFCRDAVSCNCKHLRQGFVTGTDHMLLQGSLQGCKHDQDCRKGQVCRTLQFCHMSLSQRFVTGTDSETVLL